ncbi:S1 RNA-binding domain-containing protein [Streptomyces sp. PU-14G]|uniref:S1 RNA-binding domain-containing protein n=1 Tax=Streptomyces sp. PU-14G TaxID=2800808 RepID=UPI0034DEE126
MDIEQLHPGMVCRGKVTASSATVLFVDLGNASGVVTAPNLSWRRFSHPTQVAQVGEEIVAVVLSVDREREQVSLSLKELEHDPFLDFARSRLGATVTGTVEKVAPVGVFMEVEKDVSGLLPVAALPDGTGPIQTGDTLPVKVSSINLSERRVVLSVAD